MLHISLFEISAAIGARPNQYISPMEYISHISQTSQDIQLGTLFIAIKGNRVDGHNFISEAESKGAVAAVVEKYIPNINIPQLIVPSSIDAFGVIAKLWKGRLNIPLVAVTGSVGKTSTKELISHVLSSKFNTHKSRKNFNNQLGVPMELCRIQKNHEISVIEMGMRGKSEISYLSKIARPNIGVITNIGMSHIERLGSIENIANAKIEIADGIDSEGILVLNIDDKCFHILKEQTKCKVITFGESQKADFHISDIQLGKNGLPLFRINGIPISMKNCAGKHHAYNAGAAFAVANNLGMHPEDIATQIESMPPAERRGVFSDAKCGARLLDSTYNASPDSIKASLYTLNDIRMRGKRAIAVIGEMLELGEHSKEAHQYIGSIIKDLGLDLLVTVGEYSKYIGDESNISNWKHFPNAVEAAKFMLSEADKNDVILFQASRAIGLDLVVDALEKGTLDFI